MSRNCFSVPMASGGQASAGIIAIFIRIFKLISRVYRCITVYYDCWLGSAQLLSPIHIALSKGSAAATWLAG